ncbi:hypothetical protein [Selenomonas sp. KH1T6]|uniref:hypothetical protein n=1 Tax=Selenomonas sp. KH1T6 TaxID=3158784 RepID=UPI0008A75563|nr:hypothetical protein SAMN05216583_10834 [Selenomonas ruminantium]
MEKIVYDKDIFQGEFWIWGSKIHAENFLNKLRFLHIENSKHVLGILDNDISKSGKVLQGVNIYHPDKLPEGEFVGEGDLIVICASNKVLPDIVKAINRKFPKAQYCHYENIIYDHGRDFSNFFGDFMPYGDDRRVISRCCRRDDWERPDFVKYARDLHKYDTNHHIRKTWELTYIVEAIAKAGELRAGKRGLGFAVGEERLPSYFASLGIDVLASDLPVDDERALEWASSGQHAGGRLDKLWRHDLCSFELFKKHVRYRDIDMNHIPNDEHDYDFCWSTCAIEHVGNLALSLDFVKNMLSV